MTRLKDAIAKDRARLHAQMQAMEDEPLPEDSNVGRLSRVFSLMAG